MQNTVNNIPQISSKVSAHAFHNIENVKKTIDNMDITHGYALTIKQLAHQHNMSKSLISKTFRFRYNISIHQYIIQVRMNKAKLMLTTNLSPSICDIAEKLGYSICSNFSRDFKKYTGMLPMEMLRKGNIDVAYGIEDVNKIQTV